jgi:hypothetical protein
MYIDFVSDWPAYLFMALFIFFFTYIIIISGKSSVDDTKHKK